jgi:hypothetical protein
MNNPAMLGGWLTCMVSPGGNQNQCLDIVKNYVPPFEWTIIAESLISCLGIYLFVIFGKKTLFIEWKEYIHGKVKARFDKYYNL